MSGTHPPGAKVHILPCYCNPSSCEEEDTDDKRMKWDKGPSPVSPFEHGPPSPVSPRYAQKMDKDDCEEADKYDSEDDKPLKRPKSPIKKPKALKPTPLMLTPLKFTERQYSCKLDEDGVWRYRPEDGDFKGHKSLSPSPRVEGPPSPVPVTPYANKRESPDEWPEDEAKLTCAPQKKARGKPPRKSKARSFSFHGDEIDENSSVVEVGKWVLGIGGLGLYAIECSEIFEEHNINGSGLLKMVKLDHMVKLGLKMWECEIILNGIDILKAKSKAKRSLDKAMDEV